jgi:hypothetical protein
VKSEKSGIWNLELNYESERDFEAIFGCERIGFGDSFDGGLSKNNNAEFG